MYDGFQRAHIATLSQRCPRAPVAGDRFTEGYNLGATARWPTAEVSRTGVIDPERKLAPVESRHRNQRERTPGQVSAREGELLPQIPLVIVGPEAGSA